MNEGWLRATLAEKIPEQALRRGLGPLKGFLAREAEGLRVNWEFSTRQGWLEVGVRGEDAEAFLNLLGRKFSNLPVDGSRVEKWDAVRGFVRDSGRIGFGVHVDIGVLEPVAKDGLYPLHRMRAQLVDGRMSSCRDILEDYGLIDDFPVKALVTNVEEGKFSLELADETREKLWSWTRLPFDRVLASGVMRDELEDAVKRAGLWYDVIRLEPLSLFFHCLVCKMDTDAPGVIARVGRKLRGVRLVAFRTHAG